MRKYVMAAVAISLCLPLMGTTLQQLTLDDLARQATTIIRGKLQPAATILRGSVLYTHYSVQVSDRWKGQAGSQVDIAVPGGTLNGMHQTYSGAPALVPGKDYVFFLWTSRAGLTQVMGLSQGLFTVVASPSGGPISGGPIVMRAATAENMLSVSGHAINDTNFSMKLADFQASVARALATKGGK